MNSTPLFLTTPTANAQAFQNDPPTGYSWIYYAEFVVGNLSTTAQNKVRVDGLTTTFLSDISIGDSIFFSLFGVVPVFAKGANFVDLDFDPTAYTPAAGELRIMAREVVTVRTTHTVGGLQTVPMQTQANLQGVRSLNPYDVIRRRFDYPEPLVAGRNSCTYSLSINTTTRTALRTATAPVTGSSTVFGQFPFRTFYNAGLPAESFELPYIVGGGTTSLVGLALGQGSLQIIAQPNTPVSITFTNVTLTNEPSAMPSWVTTFNQVGADVVLIGTIPTASAAAYVFDWDNGAEQYYIGFTVPQTILGGCIDGRFGIVWLGENGQWKTYYFNQRQIQNFAEVNGGVTRLGNLQRFVGLDELRESVTVKEGPIENDVLMWLKDLFYSPAIYSLETQTNLKRMYFAPSARKFRELPMVAEKNAVEFELIYSEKTPTIYEG